MSSSSVGWNRNPGGRFSSIVFYTELEPTGCILEGEKQPESQVGTMLKNNKLLQDQQAKMDELLMVGCTFCCIITQINLEEEAAAMDLVFI